VAVLVVDDDATVVNLVTAVLHRAGIEAEVALDGPSALQRLGRGRYRAVLSDLTMPGMSGLQLLREARARGHALPFLIMTAYLTPEAEAALRTDPGVAGVLRKPFDIRRLVDEVTALLRSAGAFEPVAAAPRAPVLPIASGEVEVAAAALQPPPSPPVPEPVLSTSRAVLPLSLPAYVTARMRRQALIAQAERRATALLARPAPTRIPEPRREPAPLQSEQGC
jgi:DNA-binding response OmpR family regulator